PWPWSNPSSRHRRSPHPPAAASSCLGVLTGPHGTAENLRQTGGLGAEGSAVVPVDVVKIAHARPRKADELPADQVPVAAMHGIAEHAFNRVGAEEREKQRVLDLFQAGVPVCGTQLMETAQLLEARA